MRRVVRVLLIVATVLAAGCPTTAKPRAPRSPEDIALRLRIANDEGKRAGGVAELVLMARGASRQERGLALRALARIGGPEARTVIHETLKSTDPAVLSAGLDAISIESALDDAEPGIGILIAGAARRVPDRNVAVAAVTAIGNAGDMSVQNKIARGVLLDYEPTAEASALGLARYTRRKLALEPGSREALVKATRSDAVRVRYAATYALAREVQPPHDEIVEAALAARVTDEDPETRAVAISGLIRRGAVAAARPGVEAALHDKDWRVAVEAVRALAGEHGDEVGRVIVTQAFAEWLAELKKGNAAEEHVVIEALRQLIATGAALPPDLDSRGAPELAAKWIDCLRAAVDRGDVAHCPLPDHLKLPLLGELVSAGAQDASWRRSATRTLLEHSDARVRAAGLSALTSTWKDGDDADHRAIVGTIVSSIASTDPIVAGAAFDAASTIYDDAGADKQLLDAALVERAGKEPDPELASDVFGVLAKHAIAAGADICRTAAADAKSHPVRSRAAAECTRALGEAVTAPPPSAVEPPPVDVAAVVGHDVRWHITTTRGDIVIQLDPDAAPWAVATIVALSKKGFYDHTEFHRVVPGFVVQGGDPTGSGTGGPGFSTPAEPSAGSHFVRGAVGIADAGRDSGGSQFFIMHARAPHLDGRYTYVGDVISGQNVADALLIGDQIVKTSVEVR
jgi:cyclophilin family peptidyl-prolyl cis-trans isomerase/HEAT repeat protein